jgi:hypothetical protein
MMETMERGRVAVVAKLAYELAQTGRFRDFAAIERELIALGVGTEIHLLTKPGLPDAVTSICAVRRNEREAERVIMF